MEDLTTKALKEFNAIKERYDMLEIKYVLGNKDEIPIPIFNWNAIKQALIQAEKDKKLLEIYIKENANQFDALLDKDKKALAWEITVKKNVRIYWIKSYSSVKTYNNGLPPKEQLTEEEFELLKSEVGDKV